MYLFKNKTKDIANLQKTTILIGPNGSGKTMTINALQNADKFIDPTSSTEVPITVYRAGIENLKDDIDSAKAEYKSAIASTRLLMESTAVSNEAIIDAEVATALAQLQTVATANNSDIISPNLRINYSVEKASYFNLKPSFEFNGRIYELKDLPSGARKLIHFYFQTRDMIGGKKLILLDEIDSMLHPSWIKLCTDLIKTWIADPDVFLVISTHNYEVIYQLNMHIEALALPNILSALKSPKYINLQECADFFNDFNSAVFGPSYVPVDLLTYKRKVQTKMSLYLARTLFSLNSPMILVEGLTDQMFLKEKTSKLVVSTFGYFNFGLYLSLISFVNPTFADVFVIFDGDNKLLVVGSKNYQIKQKLTSLAISHFAFPTNIEVDLYGLANIVRRSEEKMNELENNISMPVSDPNLLAILN